MSRTDVGLHVAETYARAIYELAESAEADHGERVEEVKGEMEMLGAIIAEESGFLDIMSSPQFTDDYKQGLLGRMFSGRVSELTYQFLLTANRHNRLMFLPHIIARFGEIWQAHHGISIVDLTVSENFSDSELKRVSDAIAKAMKKSIKLRLNVRPSIVGGAIIRYGDSVIDNSVKVRLHSAVQTIVARCQEQG